MLKKFLGALLLSHFDIEDHLFRQVVDTLNVGAVDYLIDLYLFVTTPRNIGYDDLVDGYDVGLPLIMTLAGHS